MLPLELLHRLTETLAPASSFIITFRLVHRFGASPPLFVYIRSSSALCWWCPGYCIKNQAHENRIKLPRIFGLCTALLKLKHTPTHPHTHIHILLMPSPHTKARKNSCRFKLIKRVERIFTKKKKQNSAPKDLTKALNYKVQHERPWLEWHPQNQPWDTGSFLLH